MSVFENARAKLVKRDNLQSVNEGSSLHTYDPAQKEQFAARINKVLAGEAWYTPLNPSGNDLWKVMGDGEFLCKLLNKCEAGAVTDAVLAAKAKKPGATTSFHNADTITHFIAAAKKAGLEFIGLGATDFSACRRAAAAFFLSALFWPFTAPARRPRPLLPTPPSRRSSRRGGPQGAPDHGRRVADAQAPAGQRDQGHPGQAGG
jgi:hypothetical protein